MKFLNKILLTLNPLKSNKASNKQTVLPKDFDKSFKDLYEKVLPYTMTTPERMYALYRAIMYVEKNKIAGEIVECGVWRGGSSMISALTLLSLKNTSRKIYLYDTYKGMNKPSKEDRGDVMEKWQKNEKTSFNEWCYAPIEDVKNNMLSTKYPKENILFIEGEVEKTIPKTVPDKISLLRLDTDWYESTYHELKHLYPLLSKNGVLIIDDYGHYEGARRAVDKYFSETGGGPYLSRIDGSCRLIIKT